MTFIFFTSQVLLDEDVNMIQLIYLFTEVLETLKLESVFCTFLLVC